MYLKTGFLLLLVLICASASAQYERRQTFDEPSNPLRLYERIHVQTDSTRSYNSWQIGIPQKRIFSQAFSLYNAIVTDTVNTYRSGDTSAFYQYVDSISPYVYGIEAYRWVQKLDIDFNGGDGAKVDFSIDSGTTWTSAFRSPYVYRFYGFQSRNIDTLAGGEVVFSGTDSVWRDIWLCFDRSWLNTPDSNGNRKRLVIRHTFISDSVDQHREGWMIDNLMAHLTRVHTVAQMEAESYLKVYPNPTTDILHIEAQKIDGFHLIEKMVLTNATGQVVGQWRDLPTHFFIPTRDYPEGLYHLRIKTNIREEILPVVIRHN